MSARTLRSTLGALGVTTALITGLSACAPMPDVTMSPHLPERPVAATHAPAAHKASATTTADESLAAAVATAAVPPRKSGDLDSGSLTRTLNTGDRNVVVDYWTDEDAIHWMAKDTKSLQLAAHIEGGKLQTTVKVSRFLVTADDGTTRTTVAEDRGEFVVTPPFSYTTALTVPPSAARATELTLYVQFDLLVETAPKSGAFFRQTVLDTLHLPLEEKDPK